MRLSLFVIAAASTIFSISAFAGDDAATHSQPANDPNQIVCRQGEPQVGTRIPGPRVCHTQREWDDLRQQSQDALTHNQINTFTQSKGG